MMIHISLCSIPLVCATLVRVSLMLSIVGLSIPQKMPPCPNLRLSPGWFLGIIFQSIFIVISIKIVTFWAIFVVFTLIFVVFEPITITYFWDFGDPDFDEVYEFRKTDCGSGGSRPRTTYVVWVTFWPQVGLRGWRRLRVDFHRFLVVFHHFLIDFDHFSTDFDHFLDLVDLGMIMASLHVSYTFLIRNELINIDARVNYIDMYINVSKYTLREYAACPGLVTDWPTDSSQALPCLIIIASRHAVHITMLYSTCACYTGTGLLCAIDGRYIPVMEVGHSYHSSILTRTISRRRFFVDFDHISVDLDRFWTHFDHFLTDFDHILTKLCSVWSWHIYTYPICFSCVMTC